MSLPTPNTRKEQYLNAIATGNASGLPTPITREEEYLDAIAKSGGGSGDGDMKKSVYDSDLDVANAGGIKAFVSDAVSGKVDKVEGKGLSTNDYSDTEKGKVADNTSAIEAIVNVTGAKNLVDIPDKTMTSSGYVCESVPIYLPAGSYILTFNFNGTSGQSQLIISDANNVDLVSKVFTVASGANEVSLTLARDGVSMTYFTHSVGDYSKFMIRDARITDPTYVPYAMTNRELTDRVSERYVSVTGDGVKTNQQLFNDLYSLVDSTKINKKSRFAIVHTNSTFWILSVSAITPNRYRFDGIVEQDATVVSAYHVQLSSTLGDCIRITNDIQTGGIQSTDLTLNAPSADYEYRVYY